MPFIRIYLVTVVILLASSAIAEVDLSDVGEVHLENSGAAGAQYAFLHGLAQTHNFEFDFAAKDFQKAQEIDPDFALAYWGEAMTYNHPLWAQQDKEAALAVLNKYAESPAARQSKAPTELERDLLMAVDILYGEGTKHEQDDLYKLFMGKLYDKYPDNVDIATFYALSIMGTAHEGREFGLYMQSAAITQNFINAYPLHPGVAHYLIHATDDPIHAPLGLAAAKAYGAIAPNAAHAQHMTTHIFLALGNWDGVIRANIRASHIVDDHRAARGKGPGGCGHYPSWLMYGHLQQGNRDAAHKIMALCHQNISDKSSEHNRSYYAWQRALYLLDTGEWAGDVAAMEAEFDDSYEPLLINQVVNGWVAVNSNDMSAAKASLKSARKTFTRLEQKWEDEGVPVNQPSRKEPLVYMGELEALIALAGGKSAKGIALLREVVSIEMDLPFGFGPPQPAKPALELLGESLLKTGQLEEAKTILKTSLSRTPNKAASVSALEAAQTALASGT